MQVRSEWSGAAAGGGPGEPTWFLNPQFRLAVPTHTTVVLTVAQMDPKVRGREHRLVAAGLMVLRAKKNTFPSRVWNATGGDAVVVAEQVYAYMYIHIYTDR